MRRREATTEAGEAEGWLEGRDRQGRGEKGREREEGEEGKEGKKGVYRQGD